MLMGFIIFGLLGIAAAIVVSAGRKSYQSRKLELSGETSLVLFPFFGAIIFLYPLIAVRVSSLPWYGRGAAYALAFFVAQYLIGLVLTKMNRCPWNYSGKGSLGGLVQVADAPLWFVSGLAVEHVYPFVKAASVALG